MFFLHLFTIVNGTSLGACVMLGTDSEVHLGFVQAAAHEHLLPGNMGWAVARGKVLSAFCSAGLKRSRSSPEWADTGNTYCVCLLGGGAGSPKLRVCLTGSCGGFLWDAVPGSL